MTPHLRTPEMVRNKRLEREKGSELEKEQDLTQTPSPASFVRIGEGRKETLGRLQGALNTGHDTLLVNTKGNRIEISTGAQTLNVVYTNNQAEQDQCLSVLRDINDCVQIVENLTFQKKERFARALKEAFRRVCAQGNESEEGFGGLTASLFLQEIQQLAKGKDSVFVHYVNSAMYELKVKVMNTPLSSEAYDLDVESAKLVGKADATINDWNAVLHKLANLLHRAEVQKRQELAAQVPPAEEDIIELKLA